jgi:hypothetical protein
MARSLLLVLLTLALASPAIAGTARTALAKSAGQAASSLGPTDNPGGIQSSNPLRAEEYWENCEGASRTATRGPAMGSSLLATGRSPRAITVRCRLGACGSA